MRHVRRRYAALKSQKSAKAAASCKTAIRRIAKSQKTAKAAASCKTAWTVLQNGKKPWERRPIGRKKFYSSCITNKHTSNSACTPNEALLLRFLYYASNFEYYNYTDVLWMSMVHVTFVFTSNTCIQKIIYKISLAKTCLRNSLSLQRLHVLCTSNDELRRCM